MTGTRKGEELQQMIADAVERYAALSPAERAKHDYEQRRSFVRGMCSSDQDYDAWCKVVDKFLPPQTTPSPVGVDGMREALEKIARNTCCDGCQEAARVAQAALASAPQSVAGELATSSGSANRNASPSTRTNEQVLEIACERFWQILSGFTRGPRNDFETAVCKSASEGYAITCAALNASAPSPSAGGEGEEFQEDADSVSEKPQSAHDWINRLAMVIADAMKAGSFRNPHDTEARHIAKSIFYARYFFWPAPKGLPSPSAGGEPSSLSADSQSSLDEETIEAAAKVTAEHRDKSRNHEEYTKAQDIYLAIRALKAKSKPSPQVGRGEPLREVLVEARAWIEHPETAALMLGGADGRTRLLEKITAVLEIGASDDAR